MTQDERWARRWDVAPSTAAAFLSVIGTDGTPILIPKLSPLERLRLEVREHELRSQRWFRAVWGKG